LQYLDSATRLSKIILFSIVCTVIDRLRSNNSFRQQGGCSCRTLLEEMPALNEAADAPREKSTELSKTQQLFATAWRRGKGPATFDTGAVAARAASKATGTLAIRTIADASDILPASSSSSSSSSSLHQSPPSVLTVLGRQKSTAVEMKV
jgi:hypothetical protein